MQMFTRDQHLQVDGSVFKGWPIFVPQFVSILTSPLNETCSNRKLDHMNHVAMEDPPRASRTLQADSRNETQPVMLGEGSAESSSPKLQRVQQQTKLQALLQHTNAPSPREIFGDVRYKFVEFSFRNQLTDRS